MVPEASYLFLCWWKVKVGAWGLVKGLWGSGNIFLDLLAEEMVGGGLEDGDEAVDELGLCCVNGCYSDRLRVVVVVLVILRLCV